MNVLSLCDGMSCGQIALKELNIPVDVYYASEIKKHAIQVTQKNFPNTIQIGNVMDYIKEITPNGEYIVDKEKLDRFGKQYEIVTDTSIMREKDIYAVPALEIDGEIYSFKEALKLVEVI